MTTIPETMRIITKNIQHTFEEMVKLLLRKTLRPTLNPLGANTKIVYNNFKSKYERGLIGSSPDDNINKYNYLMTHDSLGWTDDSLANFKVLAKFIKNNTLQRFPAGHGKIRNSLLTKSKVAYSDKEAKASIGAHTTNLAHYKNFLTYLTSKTMHHIIANKKAAFSYTCDIPYSYSYKQLESIGKDIIDQTDSSITGSDSAKMSTAMLRVKLYNLENDLADLSVNHPNIYDAYIEMLRIINSVPRQKMIWIINLIAALSFQAWDELSQQQQNTYIDVLGNDFIHAFNDNELITILLQSGSSELILTASYLYSLLKMLFVVFGYSRLVPIITDKSTSARAVYLDKLKKHFDKYRGASYRRGDNTRFVDDRNASHGCGDNTRFVDDRSESSPECSDSDSSRSGRGPCVDPCKDNLCPDFLTGDPCKPQCEPIDECIYDFIKLFGDLYPTIIGLIGGTEVFPPECIEINCNDIPPNYDCLASLPEYLWRFNDFSYCQHIEYTSAKQMHNALSSKITARAKYLQSI